MRGVAGEELGAVAGADVGGSVVCAEAIATESSASNAHSGRRKDGIRESDGVYLAEVFDYATY